MIIPSSTSNERRIRGEDHAIDLPLMALQTRYRLGAGVDRVPKIHSKIIRGGDQLLNNLTLDHSRLLEPLFRPLPLGLERRRDRGRVVEEARAQGEVGREGKTVDPMGMELQIVHERPLFRIPDPHRLVMRRRVYLVRAPPPHARHAARMAAQHMLRAPGTADPYPHRPVLAAAREPRSLSRLPQVKRLPGEHEHGLAMALELLARRLARRRIPYPHRPVHAARGQPLGVGAPAHAQNPPRVSLQRPLRRPRRDIPDPRRVIPTPRRQAIRRRRELRAEDRLPVSGDAVAEARDRLHFEDGLLLRRDGERALKRVRDAVLAQDREEVRREPRDDRVGLVRHLDAEAVRDEFLAVATQ